MEPLPPPGLLLIGGQSSEGPTSSIEMFGFENCTIPPLPETRYDSGAFITLNQIPQLAVCGGWWMGKPNSSDCLTLNVTAGQWERGTFTNGVLGDGVSSVINLEENGVFVVHNIGMSFLAPGSDSWIAGPMFSSPAVCGCNISITSFVTIHMNDTNNVQQYSLTENGVSPEPSNLWPNLVAKRYRPGCGATSYHLVVAGGVSASNEFLDSVEVYTIATKALRSGGRLRQARAFFQIIPVGSTHPRLLAIGGQNETTTLETSEWWEEESDVWEMGPGLARGRSNLAALSAMPSLVCTQSQAHTCPAAQDKEDICVFPILEPGDLSWIQNNFVFFCVCTKYLTYFQHRTFNKSLHVPKRRQVHLPYS